MTHICASKTIIIGSDNGLSPGRRQAIIWTIYAAILLLGPLGINFSEFFIGIQTFSLKKMHLKMSATKWRPFCLGLNVLIYMVICYKRIQTNECILVTFLKKVMADGQYNLFSDYLCTMNSYLFHEISLQCQISHTNQFGMRSQQSKPPQNHAHIYGKVHVPLCKWTHKHEIQISFPASRLTNGEPLMQVELNRRPPVSCVTIADVTVKSMACDEHYDVIKWKHFPRYWPLVRGNHRSLVNSQHKGHSRGVFMFSLTCA